jgi:prepilin-type N-terminal cleavage/methylation domain-containing protein
MNIREKSIHYLKSIISGKNNGFSLVETIITVSISAFLIAAVAGSVIMLYTGFNKINRNAARISEISKITSVISDDVLNPDLFPHHPFKNTGDETDDCYLFKKNEIVFFAGGGKVEYKYSDNTTDRLVIKKNNKVYKFNAVKDFSIKYYDRKDFEVIGDNEYPHYCTFNITFYDGKKSLIKMKL